MPGMKQVEAPIREDDAFSLLSIILRKFGDQVTGHDLFQS
jgi:hypothetical protein